MTDLKAKLDQNLNQSLSKGTLSAKLCDMPKEYENTIRTFYEFLR